MQDLRLSPRADLSLAMIGDFGLERYGKRQADSYVRELLDRARRLARGTLPHRACRDAFGPDMRADLRFVQAGSHWIVFTETAREVVILDFLHQSADLSSRLGEP